MFDLRYHVASLAAVFLALVIGILVGVGISDRGLVDKTYKSAVDARINDLEHSLDLATKRSKSLRRQQQAAQTFISAAYPTLVQDRLRGKRIALVFVGSVDGGLRTSIEQALADAGAPSATRVRALKMPIDAKALDAALARRPAFARYVGDQHLAALGRALGEELVAGGEAPLWDALASRLVEERSGSGQRPVDGVVVVRSVPPQSDGTARFLFGFYAGLASTRSPAVGVEVSDSVSSAVDVYGRTGLSSVDDIDTLSGRLALVMLLAGGRPGQYGLKATAKDGVLPPIEPLPTASAPGG